MDTQNETAVPQAGDKVEAKKTIETAKKVEVQAQPEVVEPKVVEAVKKVNARRVKTERKPRARRAATSAPAVKPRKARQVREPAAAAPQIEKDIVMNFDATNWMNNFNAVPGADKVQNLFAEAGERGQQLAERSREAAGELVELTRSNVEALVESGKIAAAGAQTLGQDALARTREGFEQAATQVKSLSQAQSATEYLQLQGEIARTQFDRLVADGSRFAESFVKLAGEAFQPLSNRAALNAEKLNDLTA